MLHSTLHEKEFKAISNFNLKKETNYAGIPCIEYTGKGHFFGTQEDVYKKQQIVLHYTVGQAAGDLYELTQKGHKSVAFYITTTGRLVQFFNPDYWAYHLGPNCIGGNTIMSKKTIGIEIQNYGWLEKRGDVLRNAYGIEYCSINDTDVYDIKEYRKQKYWCRFNDAQYATLKKLLEALTMQYNIPYKFLPSEIRLDYTSKVKDFAGITTHVNYRKDKWDIGPNFDWERI